MNTLACRNEERRVQVRHSAKLAGFDYLEVSEDHLTLRVYFLGQLPSDPLEPGNFRVEGGRRVRGIRVVKVFAKQFGDPELDDYVDVVVDRFGDFSTYTLRAVVLVRDQKGASKAVPHPEFDRAYNQIDFTFTAGCPTPLDCEQEEVCPPPQRIQPAVNYLAKDYASFRQLIFDRLAVVIPDWKNRFVPDIGVTLVELLAYSGDYLSYYQDAVATEAYLGTARQRVSVRRHARLVDYAVHEGCNSRAFVVVGTSDKLLIEPRKVQFITPAAKNLSVELTTDGLKNLTLGAFEVFEAIERTQLYPGHENIPLYTWGNAECCLPRGARAATLVDEWAGEGKDRTRKLKLKANDFLIFEEVLGPKTGQAGDADSVHRWVVRLTSVTPDVDPLTDSPVLNIEWDREDALPFPLCLSSLGLPPDCKLIENVSVARGNVVLVDNGESTSEDLPKITFTESIPACAGENLPSEVTRTLDRFRPFLSKLNVTFRELPPVGASASRALAQGPHRAVPVVTLADGKWTAAADLIESRSTDREFVVETDNERRAWLRFGDGTHGALPPAGVSFRADYRVGGGITGNVGREAIAHVVWTTNVSGLITSVRNPLEAQGGTDPQSIEEVKLFAPHTFRKRLERAIIAADYAAIAEREFPLEVQRAAATLRWNGSWYEALVAIDARGSEEESPELLRSIQRRLYNYRRMGHDLRVEPATRVPILIVLAVCVKGVYLRAHVLADLEAEFSTDLLSGGRLGFFHPDNLTFGGGLYLSQVVSRAQLVPGVESVKVRSFERMFDGPHGEIDAGLIRLGPFEIAQCDSDLSFPENGQIQFQLGGGR
jgi:hypothetical protein